MSHSETHKHIQQTQNSNGRTLKPEKPKNRKTPEPQQFNNPSHNQVTTASRGATTPQRCPINPEEEMNNAKDATPINQPALSATSSSDFAS